VEHNIHVLNLPAHTTHLLQVADISVFGPFKKYISKSLATWRDKYGPYIAPCQYAAATRWAWEQATTRQNVTAGFEKAGLVPVNHENITPAIYKEGVRTRQLRDDSSRIPVPGRARVPIPVLDTSSSSSPLVLFPPAAVEPVSSILTPPPLLCAPAPATKRRVGIPTTFSRVLTSEQSMNIIRKRQQDKENKEAEKAEKKQKRDEKKAAAVEKPKPKPKHSVRLQPRQRKPLSNITNTCTTSSSMVDDPYDVNAN
jgi:hypothetical protein